MSSVQVWTWCKHRVYTLIKREIITSLDVCAKIHTTQNVKMTSKSTAAKEAALWGMCIGDAVSMPVHWYYNPADIKSNYHGWLSSYVVPNNNNPTSFLTKASVGDSGKKDKDGNPVPVIGNVILHDKLSLWKNEENSTLHYHQGMNSGDNTLNVIMALKMMKTLQRVDPDFTVANSDLRAAVLEDYVQFLTTPGTHNDTFAETFHRGFFGDWAALSNPPSNGEDILKFAEERSSKLLMSTESSFSHVGSLGPATPWILHTSQKSETECVQAVTEFVKLTHPTAALVPYVDIYARLLHAVVNGFDLHSEVMKCLSHSALGGPQKREMVLNLIEKAQRFDKGSEERLAANQNAIKEFGMACGIEGALSCVLYLALQYADDFEGGILENANCGGDNCHRGAPLGALLGAHVTNQGRDISQKWKDGLGSAQHYLSSIKPT